MRFLFVFGVVLVCGVLSVCAVVAVGRNKVLLQAEFLWECADCGVCVSPVPPMPR